MTIEYPSPEMILAGEVSPRRCNRAVERTKAERDIRRAEKAGQERVWCMADLKQKEVRAVYCSDKKKSR